MPWLDKMLDGAWDTATGAYDKYLDFESKKYELEALKDIAFLNSAEAADDDDLDLDGVKTVAGLKIEYIAFAGLAVVALLLLRK